MGGTPPVALGLFGWGVVLMRLETISCSLRSSVVQQAAFSVVAGCDLGGIEGVSHGFARMDYNELL